MAKIAYQMPDRMAHLKLDDRGYPIPYFCPTPNGKPDFRYQDQKKRQACIDHKLCSVCGKRLLDKQFWFICGPLGLKNQIHSDAPMHAECADYAINVCPHLAFYKAERRSEHGNDPHQLRSKPETLFLIRADKSWTVPGPQGQTYIKFRTVSFHQYIYRNNKLEKA